MNSEISEFTFIQTMATSPEPEFAVTFNQFAEHLMKHMAGAREFHQPVIIVCERFFKEIPNLSGSVWQKILPSIVTSFVNCFSDNLSAIQKTLHSDMYSAKLVLEENTNILCSLDILIQSLNSIHDISIEIVSTIPKDLISAMLFAFEFCKNKNELNESVTTFFRKNYDLLCHYFIFINKLQINCQYVDEFNLLTNILEKLYQVGTLVISLDLKTMAELWKGYTNVLKKYSASLRNEFDICKIIRFLITQITEQITTLHENRDEKLVNLTCKISFFLMKIVLKLCECFTTCYGDCVPELFEFILFLYRHSSCVSQFTDFSVEITSKIDSYLLPGVDPLIGRLINERSFANHYLQFDHSKICNTSERIAFLLVLTMILKKLLSCSKEILSLWIEEEYCVLNLVFASVNEFNKELCHDVSVTLPCFDTNNQDFSLYDALIINFSCLIINEVSCNKFYALEQLLISNLQSKTMVIIFVSDLWCILARYGSSELCLQHTKYLVSIFNQNTRNVFLKSLIKRLFSFLPSSYQLQVILMLKNLDILSTEIRPEISSKIISDCTEKYKCLRKSEAENYPEMIRLVNVLVDLDPNFHTSMTDFVIHIWKRLNNQSMLCLNLHDFRLFINAFANLSRLTSLLISHLDVVSILRNIRDLLSCESTFIKLCSLDILRNLETYEITSNFDETVNLIAILFNGFLKDKNCLVKEYALEVFTHFSHVTKYEEIISKSLAKDEKITTIVAKYLKKELSDSGNLQEFLRRIEEIEDTNTMEFGESADQIVKKIKLDDDICDKIIQVETNVMYILDFVKSNNLSVDQKNSVRKMLNVVDELKNVI